MSLVDYFQDCSTFHSEDCGIGIDFLSEQNRAWMILSWQIEILRLPKLCDKVRIQTWAYEFKGFYGLRNFTMLDESGAYLAKANSVWALVDTVSGRPVRVMPEQVEGYTIEPKLEMEYLSRKIRVPDDCRGEEPFQVCRHHLDTNGHVNNGQYIRMAEEYLPDNAPVSKLRVEYRHQAFLHDTIVPAISRSEQETIVTLNNSQGVPYSIVEFVTSKSSHA
jgi:acyl-ACP thioesterase